MAAQEEAPHTLTRAFTHGLFDYRFDLFHAPPARARVCARKESEREKKEKTPKASRQLEVFGYRGRDQVRGMTVKQLWAGGVKMASGRFTSTSTDKGKTKANLRAQRLVSLICMHWKTLFPLHIPLQTLITDAAGAETTARTSFFTYAIESLALFALAAQKGRSGMHSFQALASTHRFLRPGIR